jgi:hypothetical protein
VGVGGRLYSIEASTNTELYTDFNAIVKVLKSPEISFQQRSEGRFLFYLTFIFLKSILITFARNPSNRYEICIEFCVF